MYIYIFLVRITDTMAFQNNDFSSGHPVYCCDSEAWTAPSESVKDKTELNVPDLQMGKPGIEYQLNEFVV
jgi:hypothetical protein